MTPPATSLVLVCVRGLLAAHFCCQVTFEILTQRKQCWYICNSEETKEAGPPQKNLDRKIFDSIKIKQNKCSGNIFLKYHDTSLISEEFPWAHCILIEKYKGKVMWEEIVPLCHRDWLIAVHYTDKLVEMYVLMGYSQGKKLSRLIGNMCLYLHFWKTQKSEKFTKCINCGSFQLKWTPEAVKL